MASGSKVVIYAALAGNLAIAVAKFAAFLLTRSSAMLTESIHSLVDTGNQGLLLYGLHRAARPPDEAHPFGHGMELYFWSFVVALLIFSLGGAVSIYEGVLKIIDPQPIDRPWVNYVVLGASMAFEGSSFTVALKEFNLHRRSSRLLESIRRSKDPSVFAVLLEDGAAMAGLLVALVGVSVAVFLHLPQADGVASVVIGVMLIVVAAFLANETRSLLTGEAAAPHVVAAVRARLEKDPRIDCVSEVLTMHLGPREILLGITLDLADELSVGQVEALALELTRDIEIQDDRITRVFLRPRPMALASPAAVPVKA
jgi:cation diffusion facilitator family transporter